MNRNDFDEYRTFVRWSIQGATIARLAQDKIASGAGPPTAEDVKDYADEGGAVADLWEEGLPA